MPKFYAISGLEQSRPLRIFDEDDKNVTMTHTFIMCGANIRLFAR